MRRHPYRIDPAIRAYVFMRDQRCFLAKVEPGHVCMDIWRNVHASDDLDKLTLEHVHTDGSMMGKRAPSIPQSMVALCGYANVKVPNRSQRDAMRAYLRALYPVDHDAHVDRCPGCPPVAVPV